MTALDTKARATALRLLEKYGKPCTFYQIGEGAYDPSTGDIATAVNVTTVTKAIIEDYQGIDFISGAVEKTDRKVTLPASLQREPSPNDKLSIDQQFYTVVSVLTVWSGEQAALYELQVRK